MDPLTRYFWVRLPRRLTRRSRSLVTLAADGHVLVGLGWLAGLLPLLALGGGFAVGAAHPGFDEAFTESLALVTTVLVVGTLSTQLGAWATVGFALGDFVVFHPAWTTRPEFGADTVTGMLANPVVANLVVERVPLLIQYALLASLAVGVPMGARSLAASVSLRLQLPGVVHLVVSTVLLSLTAFVLARFWAAAAPLAIRPVFTWDLDQGINQASPPPGAIVPVQTNIDWIARTAVVAVLGRCVVTYVLGRARAARVDRAEVELLQPMERQPRAPGPLAALVQAIVFAAMGVLLLAGMITDWWVAAVLGGIFLVGRLARSGWLPLPTRRWRDIVNRVPVLIRFGAVLLVVNGIARAVAGAVLGSGTDTTENFQLMLWPIVASVLLMAILLPDPARQLTDAPRIPPAQAAGAPAYPAQPGLSAGALGSRQLGQAPGSSTP